jgi:hypothetical protein
MQAHITEWLVTLAAWSWSHAVLLASIWKEELSFIPSKMYDTHMERV